MSYTVWVLSPELSHNYEKTNYVCYILYIMNSLTDTLLNDIEQYIDLLGTNNTDNQNKLEITSLKKNVKNLKNKLSKLRSKNNLLYKKIKNVDFDNDSSSKIKNLVQLRDSNIQKQSELITDINNLKKKCKYKPQLVQKVVLNPLTKRYIKLDGKLAKKLIKDNIVKKCKTNYILNPRTNRCVSRKGKIGKKMAAVFTTLGVKVIAYDLYPDKNWPVLNQIRYTSLKTLLKESDIISLHVAPMGNGKPIIGKKEISQMKPSVLIINTSRGQFIDEKALFDALSSKKINGVGLDVYNEEPYIGNLIQFENVVLTPHVATLTKESRLQMEIEATENLLEFFNK